jgi:hypothetical protein
MVHPDDPGICDVAEPVTSRRYDLPAYGPVDVPLCAPCAVAQGIRTRRAVWEIRLRLGPGEPWSCGYCSQPAPGPRCGGCGRTFDWRSR